MGTGDPVSKCPHYKTVRVPSNIQPRRNYSVSNQYNSIAIRFPS